MAKVLVVDDDVVTLEILSQLLTRWGHTAIKASSAELGLQILECNTDISLIITDYMLPKMDGRSFTKRIRGISIFERVPVIMISGVISLNSISSVLADGVDRFLPKPVKASELKEYVASMLQGEEFSSLLL